MTGLPGLGDDLDIVTFDIFDTLLHRKVRAPVDVFELVRLKAFESDYALHHHAFLDTYAAARRAAEAAARKVRRETATEGEITLDDIFAQMQRDHDLPQDLVAFLRETELSLETAVLFASPQGLELYREARGRGLSVGFLSDMYLPAGWIAAKLVAEGFEGADALPLYVSGEHGATKYSGRLYRLAAEQQGWALDPRWLHVGDNRKADITQAEALGLRTRLAEWADVRNTPQPDEAAYGQNAVQAVTGFADCRPSLAFQPEGELERIGYRVFGPLLFGFTIWLLWQARQRGLGKLVFVARDGQLPMQLFDRLKARAGCGAVRSEYFYMSRKVGYLTGMREWDEAQTHRITGGRGAKSARRSFQAVGLDATAYQEDLARFGIPDLDAGLPPDEAWRVKKALSAASMDILAANATRRRDLQEYYTDAMEGEERIGFVDIGWVGNIQRLFANSLPDSTARTRIDGLYLGQLPGCAFNEARGIRMQSFMTRDAYALPIQKALHAGGIELLEFAMTADHGTTIDLARDADGIIRPVLETPSDQERDYAQRAMRVQAGIQRFQDEQAWLLDRFDLETLSGPHWAQPLLRLITDPTPDEIAALANLTHSDAPGTNAERIPLVVPLDGWRRFSPPHRRGARKASYWKAAFDKLHALT
jgi:predicted HAD superfamily hydrolase